MAASWKPSALLALAALVLRVFPAERLQQEASRELDDEDEEPKEFPCECAHFKDVLNCDQQAEFKFLGQGSFAQTWQVKDPDGKDVVLKLLTVTSEHKLLYPKDFRTYSELIAMAKRECEAANEMKEGAENAAYKGESRKRIMGCLGHNLDTKSGEQPLYELLEFGGRDDLESFISNYADNDKWSLEVARKVIKQILEVLDYLQSFPQPWIHHDIKPQNIVVREEGGEPSVMLVDMGSAVHHDPKAKTWCDKSSGSAAYAPPEHKKENAGGDRSCRIIYYDPEKPKAFDAYSFGAVLVEMAGVRMDDAVVLATISEDALKGQEVMIGTTLFQRYNWELHRAVFERHDVATTVLKWVVAEAEAEARSAAGGDSESDDEDEYSLIDYWAGDFCKSALADADAMRFLNHAFRALRTKPEERPLPAELLKEPWMQRA